MTPPGDGRNTCNVTEASGPGGPGSLAERSDEREGTGSTPPAEPAFVRGFEQGFREALRLLVIRGHGVPHDGAGLLSASVAAELRAQLVAELEAAVAVVRDSTPPSGHALRAPAGRDDSD